MVKTLNVWRTIDGGGNRPAFDAAIATEASLCILPFRAPEEDLDTVAEGMRRIPNAISMANDSCAERAAASLSELPATSLVSPSCRTLSMNGS